MSSNTIAQFANRNSLPHMPVLSANIEPVEVHPYLRSRGISLETAKEFDIRFLPEGRGYLSNRILIPVHEDNGALVTCVGRRVRDGGDDERAAYLAPPGFDRSRWVFNLHRAICESSNAPLVVVEGFFDAMNLYQNGCKKVVAVMGHSVSDAQRELILRYTSTRGRVIIAFRGTGKENSAAMISALQLVKYCFVKIHEFENPNADPEHLSRLQVEQLLRGFV